MDVPSDPAAKTIGNFFPDLTGVIPPLIISSAAQKGRP